MNKSAVKKEYKETKRPMGIYRIRTHRNNTVYVGFGIDIWAKINRHRAELRFRSHKNSALQDAWNALGDSSFEFEILDLLEYTENSQTDPVEELHVLLEMWIHNLEKAGCTVVRL